MGGNPPTDGFAPQIRAEQIPLAEVLKYPICTRSVEPLIGKISFCEKCDFSLNRDPEWAKTKERNRSRPRILGWVGIADTYLNWQLIHTVH